MKKIFLVLFLLIMIATMVSGAKYTFVGDSRLALDTAVCNEFQRTLNDGSTFVNRAVSGYRWSNFDILVSNFHWADWAIAVDTCDYVVLQVGVNNTWDTLASAYGLTGWIQDLQEYRHLDKFVKIIQANNKIPIIVEMQSSFSEFYVPDTVLLKNQLATIQRRNAMRREYCASHNILYVSTFDTFALENGRPNPIYYNSDLIHFNRDGSLLFGQLLANPIVPTSIKTYVDKTMRIDSITSYASTSKRLYTLDLLKITDSVFWYNVKPNGSNLLLYVNDNKIRRNLREFDSYAKKGIMRFQYNGAITKIELKTSSTLIDTNVSVFDSSSIMRLYPFDEANSFPTTLTDIANGINGTVATQTMLTYAGGQPITDSLKLYKYISGATTGLKSANTGFSGLSKLTIDFWIWIYNNSWWTAKNNILLSLGSGSDPALRMAWVGNMTISIGNTSTYIRAPLSACTTYITPTKWHKITISLDLTQSIQSDKYKVIIDSVDRTSDFARTGTIGTALPTFTDSLNIIGWYTQSNFWPTGAAFKDYRFFNDAITPVEAIADYKIQTGNFVVESIPIQQTRGYRRNSIFTMYNSNYGATTGQVKLNTVNMPITFWSNDSVKVRIPSWMGRGYYTYKVYNTAGTLVDSTYHGVRIMVPQITGGE